ncbi:hypothetical protein Pcinc_023739 [Petrolisthes cinctipes]|uniref:Uncharacterized protein n=1 Tax=Petrolisthes cinctipes TaxID=88211 RepID=A0AAE1FBW4_PETCI|nr:hypothetical protein Pcinc_023739 [Petrolisthes cinctipes]
MDLAHTSAVNCLQLLSEGTVLAGGDKDRKIIAWDCEEDFEKITGTKAGGVRTHYPQRPGHNDDNIYAGTVRNMILKGSLQRRFNQNATTERTLASLIESHQVIIATVTTFSEKLKALASRFELISDHVLKVPPQRSTQSGIASVTLPPSASRKNRNT